MAQSLPQALVRYPESLTSVTHDNEVVNVPLRHSPRAAGVLLQYIFPENEKALRAIARGLELLPVFTEARPPRCAFTALSIYEHVDDFPEKPPIVKFEPVMVYVRRENGHEYPKIAIDWTVGAPPQERHGAAYDATDILWHCQMFHFLRGDPQVMLSVTPPVGERFVSMVQLFPILGGPDISGSWISPLNVDAIRDDMIQRALAGRGRQEAFGVDTRM